ncbi:type II toxin-antitoxin system HicA family toxin [Minwuia sp.]|uniref:type II toxin-antitoxin system HicA family toxin n=1 Tax=Minwuia sp. TaxID=2493630 RepID=UPI003A90489F
MPHFEKDSRKIRSLLIKDGFELVGSRGSHQKFRKDGRTVVLPHPKKDLPHGTVRSIYRQAGWIK